MLHPLRVILFCVTVMTPVLAYSIILMRLLVACPERMLFMMMALSLTIACFCFKRRVTRYLIPVGKKLLNLLDFYSRCAILTV